MLRLAFYEAVAGYGLDGEYDGSNQIVEALMQQVVFNVDRAKDRYNSAKKGGRKAKYDAGEVEGLLQMGYNKKEIAEKIGCSVRTIERAIKKIKEKPEGEVRQNP